MTSVELHAGVIQREGLFVFMQYKLCPVIVRILFAFLEFIRHKLIGKDVNERVSSCVMLLNVIFTLCSHNVQISQLPPSGR